MGWNDTLSAGLDWQATAFIQQYWQALNQRRAAVGATTYPFIAAGADIQKCDNSVPPASSTGNYSIAKMQNDLFALATFYVETEVSGAPWPTYNAIEDFTYTTASLRAAAGLNSSGFTRKYPREFGNDSSSTYTDGSSFSNGHRARRLSDLRVCDRVSGAWVATSNPFGDAPDVITAFGDQQAGDYIGLWIFEELRSVINLFTKTIRLPNGGTGISYNITANNQVSEAAAKAAVEAAWPGTAGTVFGPKAGAHLGQAASGSTPWTAIWFRQNASWSLNAWPVSGITPTWKLFVASHMTPGYDGYHAQGSGLTEDTWVQKASGSGNMSEQIIGGGSATLTWPSSPPPGGIRQIGFDSGDSDPDIDNSAVVFTWPFTQRPGV